jgi:hypothetical protein
MNIAKVAKVDKLIPVIPVKAAMYSEIFEP